MKTHQLPLILVAASMVMAAMAAEPGAPVPGADTTGASQVTNAPPAQANPATPAPPADLPPPAPADAAAPTASDGGTNGIHLNFRNAPLSLVLDYLSDAAGFIINKEADVRGTVDVWSKEPVTKDDAVKLLNSVLRKNGYAVTRDGRILTIISLENAKTSDLEILQGANYQDVEKGDEVVTQIIPVRYANATQLMNNLQVLLPTSASLSVNESANTLILVATKTDIRRMLRIVSALDTSIASISSIKVFPLKYADAKELATVIQQLFTQQSNQQQGGGFNPRAQFFAMMRGGGPGGQGGNNGANAAGTKVTAAADDVSNSLIVSASTEMMATITDMIEQLDQPVTDVTELRVFKLVNADPTELADQLTQLFPEDTSSSSQNQGGGGRFRFFGGRNNTQSTTSDRMKKKGRVLAVPDARTSSLVVSAAGDLMPQIAEMVERLDASPAKKEVVRVYDLQNADPQDVNQILQDLFQRSGNIRANNNNNARTSLLGQGNPLTQRATQQQNTTATTGTSFGTSRGGSSIGF